MKNLNQKAVAVAVIMSSAMAFSATVNAEEASVEKVLAQVVFNQGKRVMNDLSAQLQQGIKQELNQFSINYSASWLSTEEEVLVSKNKEPKNSNTTPKSSEE